MSGGYPSGAQDTATRADTCGPSHMSLSSRKQNWHWIQRGTNCLRVRIQNDACVIFLKNTRPSPARRPAREAVQGSRRARCDGVVRQTGVMVQEDASGTKQQFDHRGREERLSDLLAKRRAPRIAVARSHTSSGRVSPGPLTEHSRHGAEPSV